MIAPKRFAGVGLLFSSLVVAQTWTDCDPLAKTDCPIPPALGTEYNFDWTDPSNSTTWDPTGGDTVYTLDGGKQIINKQKESPTLTSSWYIFFGRVEVHMKAARGQGIVSSIVIQSDVRDEIDWELIGGDEGHVQTNYFGKGWQETYDRGGIHPVTKPMDEFKNYTIDWTPERIEFWVEQQLIRTLTYAQGKNKDGEDNYPQTPSFVRIGTWAGGDVENNNEGVVEWAGGPTDFSQAPFEMDIKSVKVTDYGPRVLNMDEVKEYVYSDTSGRWQSIQGVAGNSSMKEALLAEPEHKKSVSEKFNELPGGSKIAVYACSAGAGAALIAAFAFVCFKRRRQGRNEAAAYRAKQEAMDEEDKKWVMQNGNAKPDALGYTGADSNDFKGGVVGTVPMGGRLSFEDGPGQQIAQPSTAYMGVSQVGSPTSPAFNPNYNPGQFNRSMSPPGAGQSDTGYTEFYAPQPRANTNGQWNAPDLERANSDASQWGAPSPNTGTQNGAYGRLPNQNEY